MFIVLGGFENINKSFQYMYFDNKPRGPSCTSATKSSECVEICQKTMSNLST